VSEECFSFLILSFWGGLDYTGAITADKRSS
jgi:predicted aconitase with swiveling domain